MDLVVVTISGVQRFIAESRSTADLYAGSALMSDLAAAMIAAVPDPDLLILPAPGSDGMPSRVAALAEAGTGRMAAEAMTASVVSRWDEWLASVFAAGGAGPPGTPGFPAVRWVVVPVAGGGYRDGWERAQAALAARKRIRDFPGYHVGQKGVCALTGRWPAVPREQVPRGGNTRRGEALSAVGHVKRWYGRERGGGFPSTWSIASAPYRDAIIRRGEANEVLWDAVTDLNGAVSALSAGGDPAIRAALRQGSGRLPGLAATDDEAMGWLREIEGAWCSPETWEPGGLRRDYDLAGDPDEELCGKGRDAARALARAARKAGIAPLTPYLAVVAQDADRMGERLAGFPAGIADPPGWHRRVSGALADVAQRQRDAAESQAHLGRVVYAGGDDFLALVPAGRALAAARSVNELFANDEALTAALDRPSASTAIVFFHASWPLQSAISMAQSLLHDAKERDRPGLGVAVLARGGERTRVVLPWRDREASPERLMIGYLEELAAAISGPLSGRLAAGLEADRSALAELGRDWLERELARRAARQGIAASQAPAAGRLLAALRGNAPGDEGLADCAGSVLIARFLAAQARVPA